MNKLTISVIGPFGSGKTAFITRFPDGDFQHNYIATIGAVTYNKEYEYDSNNYVDITIYDHSGQDIANTMKYKMYDDSDAFIVMYDGTSRDSKKEALEMIDEIKSKYPNRQIVVCVNKCDLPNFKNPRKKIKGLQTVITSAKACINFTKPFDLILKKHKFCTPSSYHISKY